ncbi:InlB B-repeat-containing protein [Ruminococcus flavefaciens]|uniref:InlB B-repeat-containing protein n=1 Tax=Ruminococcus flavefaciens TaxID=1265 RepID=UPI0004669ED5|nr:hypothetical protein [Ruminococcus flavefaciens]
MRKTMKSIVSSVAAFAVALSYAVIPFREVFAADEAPSIEAVCNQEEKFSVNSISADELLYNYMLTQSGVTPKPDETRNGKIVCYESSITAGSKLGGREAIAYNVLKREVARIASGQRTSTEIDLTAEELGIEGASWSAADLGVNAVVSNNHITDEGMAALSNEICDFRAVINALLADCPYEMYWCDKTSYQTSMGSIGAKKQNGEWKLYLGSNPKVIFKVSADYSVNGATGTTNLPDNRVSVVASAISNAQQIVNDNSDKSGKELLAAYRDAICGLTDYNYAAAGGGAAYGDPWQLIYVFDSDNSTKVVCEGYAKAFKYLCDLSSERLEGISCLIATGTFSGPHMWNVVNMDDNRSYLVDITQCDSIDRPVEEYINTFFLATPSDGTYNTNYEFYFPGTSYTEGAYIYSYPSNTYTYVYDTDTLETYNSSYLMLSTDPYVEVEHVKTEVNIEYTDINSLKTSSTVYAETFSNEDYPLTAIYLDGYDFSGWNINGTLYTDVSDAQATLAAAVAEKPSEPIKIKEVYTKKPQTYNVSITGGKLTDGSTNYTAQVSTLLTVRADTAEHGKKFSHWLRNGVKVSSNSCYSFRMPSYAVTLKAVYVADTTAVNQAGTAIIESVTPNTSAGKVSFVSVCNIPTSCKFVKGGLVATNDGNIGINVTADNAVYVKLSSKVTENTKNLKYTWTKSNVTADTVWYVRGYLVYKDSSGVEHTVYSDAVKANINGIIKDNSFNGDEGGSTIIIDP